MKLKKKVMNVFLFRPLYLTLVAGITIDLFGVTCSRKLTIRRGKALLITTAAYQ